MILWSTKHRQCSTNGKQYCFTITPVFGSFESGFEEWNQGDARADHCEIKLQSRIFLQNKDLGIMFFTF